MGGNALLALLNPAITLVFSCVFFAIWVTLRQRRYVLTLSLAYLACGAGFLINQLQPYDSIVVTSLASNIVFVAGTVLMSRGIIARYGRPQPNVALAVLASAALASLVWFLFVHPDLAWRIYGMNFASGAIFLVTAAEIRAVADKKLIDRIIFWIVLTAGLHFFPRTLIVMAVDPPSEALDSYLGSTFWITLNFSVAIFSLLLALAQIIAAAIDVIDELRRDVITDPLTQLLNRRGFDDRVDTVLSHAGRSGRKCSLVLCDLDHFKQINDTYGHAAGDKVIAHFGRLLEDAVACGGYAGRVGGEEFAVLLVNADAATARLFCEGIRTILTVRHSAPVCSLPEYTASFGIAERMGSEASSQLFHRADEALYKAKRSGRNRIRLADAHSGRGRATRESPNDAASGHPSTESRRMIS